MSIEEINSSTFLTDVIILIRDSLRDNIADPIIRPTNENFIMTSYPKNAVTYPIITVVDNGIVQQGKLGMGSQGTMLRLTVEIRIWARNVIERDTLFNKIHDYFRTNQLSGDDLTGANLHDFYIGSVVNVPEKDVQSKVMEMTYLFLCI